MSALAFACAHIQKRRQAHLRSTWGRLQACRHGTAHGHCDDGMVSYIKLLTDDGERNLMDEDQTCSAPSRTTYVAQRIVFAAVQAGAELVGRFIGCVAYGIPMDTRQRGLVNFHH